MTTPITPRRSLDELRSDKSQQAKRGLTIQGAVEDLNAKLFRARKNAEALGISPAATGKLAQLQSEFLDVVRGPLAAMQAASGLATREAGEHYTDEALLRRHSLQATPAQQTRLAMAPPQELVIFARHAVAEEDRPLAGAVAAELTRRSPTLEQAREINAALASLTFPERDEPLRLLTAIRDLAIDAEVAIGEAGVPGSHYDAARKVTLARMKQAPLITLPPGAPRSTAA
jgi:hypothetical protein